MPSDHQHRADAVHAQSTAPRGPWASILIISAAVVLGFGLLGMVWLIARPLALLALAFSLAQTLSPLVDWLEQRMSRSMAVIGTYLAGLTLIALLAWLVYPVILRESQRPFDRLPQLVQQAQYFIERWTTLSAAQIEKAFMDLASRFGHLIAVPLATLSAIFELVVVLFLSLYLLLSGPALCRFVVSCVAPRHRPRARRLMRRAGGAMGGYFRGVALAGTVVGTLTWIALSLIGIPYAPVLALLAALGELVPYIGPIVAALPAVALALTESPTRALLVAAVYVGLQQIESYIVLPNVMRSQTKIDPALVLFALAAGFAVGGVLGAITAIPLFAALRVIVVFGIAPAARRGVRAHGRGPRPAAALE